MTSPSRLPRWTQVLTGRGYVPRCDLCKWTGRGYAQESEARRACRDHARSKRHYEDATAVARAEREERSA